MSRVTDGATLRQQRIMDLVAMLRAAKGASILEIQAFMLSRHGLKFDTTSSYVREMHLSGLIVEDGGKWILTQKLNRLYGSMKR